MTKLTPGSIVEAKIDTSPEAREFAAQVCKEYRTFREIDTSQVKAEPMDPSLIAYDKASGLFYHRDRPQDLPLIALRVRQLEMEMNLRTSKKGFGNKVLRWLRLA